MNAVAAFTRELETLLADTAFSGLRNIHPGIPEKFRCLSGSAAGLGMEKGAALLAEFAEALRNYRLSGEGGGSAAALLCAVDFYNKNVKGNINP
jgi:hypothetical protein